jgi:hypothetical protein
MIFQGLKQFTATLATCSFLLFGSIGFAEEAIAKTSENKNQAKIEMHEHIADMEKMHKHMPGSKVGKDPVPAGEDHSSHR